MDQFYDLKEGNRRLTPRSGLKSDTIAYGQTVGSRFILSHVFKLGESHRLWIAEDAVRQELVVIKERSEEIDQSEESFLLEIEHEMHIYRVLGDLLHVPRVYGFLQSSQMDGVVMQRVEGKSLLEIRDIPWEFDEFALLTAGLFEAIDCVHKRGVVHRDVRPSNTMLDTKGVVHIVDWKNSTWIGMSDQRKIRGILNYLPPERINGNGKRAASIEEDIYEAGATLLRVGGGDIPFSHGAICSQIAYVVPPTINETRKRIGLKPFPNQWDEMIAATLRKEPTSRLSIQEITERLGLKEQRSRTMKRWREICSKLMSKLPFVGSLNQHVDIIGEEKSTACVDQEPTVRLVEDPTIRLMQASTEGVGFRKRIS